MRKVTNHWLAVVLLAVNIPMTASAQWSTSGNDIFNTNSGNVGVGTSTPLYLLHTSKNMTEPTIAVQNGGGTGGATFQMIDNASGADWKFKATLNGGFKIRDHANLLDVIVVEPGSAANVLYIDDEGWVGIGTPVPTAKLTVAGAIHSIDSVMVDDGRLATGDFRASALNGVINCGGAYRTYTNTISDLTDPNPDFAVGDEDLYIQDVLEIEGQAYKPGGGSWTVLSDARFKKNVEPFTDGLAKVMQIRPVSFQYNEKSSVIDQDKRYIGILAQDMLAIAPYMVEEKLAGQRVMEIENGVDKILEPGTMAYTFDPSALDYLIINAVQEQQQMLESQQKRMESLEKENAELRARLDSLSTALKAQQ